MIVPSFFAILRLLSCSYLLYRRQEVVTIRFCLNLCKIVLVDLKGDQITGQDDKNNQMILIFIWLFVLFDISFFIRI